MLLEPTVDHTPSITDGFGVQDRVMALENAHACLQQAPVDRSSCSQRRPRIADPGQRQPDIDAAPSGIDQRPDQSTRRHEVSRGDVDIVLGAGDRCEQRAIERIAAAASVARGDGNRLMTDNLRAEESNRRLRRSTGAANANDR